MKYARFICEYLLMNIVAMTWKVFPIPQEDMTLFWNNNWALTLIAFVLAFIIVVCIALEERE